MASLVGLSGLALKHDGSPVSNTILGGASSVAKCSSSLVVFSFVLYVTTPAAKAGQRSPSSVFKD
jgi:hypothetical protein